MPSLLCAILLAGHPTPSPPPHFLHPKAHVCSFTPKSPGTYVAIGMHPSPGITVVRTAALVYPYVPVRITPRDDGGFAQSNVISHTTQPPDLCSLRQISSISNHVQTGQNNFRETYTDTSRAGKEPGEQSLRGLQAKWFVSALSLLKVS